MQYWNMQGFVFRKGHIKAAGYRKTALYLYDLQANRLLTFKTIISRNSIEELSSCLRENTTNLPYEDLLFTERTLASST